MIGRGGQFLGVMLPSFCNSGDGLVVVVTSTPALFCREQMYAIVLVCSSALTEVFCFCLIMPLSLLYPWMSQFYPWLHLVCPWLYLFVPGFTCFVPGCSCLSIQLVQVKIPLKVKTAMHCCNEMRACSCLKGDMNI